MEASSPRPGLICWKSKFRPGVHPSSLFLSRLLKYFWYLYFVQLGQLSWSGCHGCWVSTFTFPAGACFLSSAIILDHKCSCSSRLKTLYTCSLTHGLVEGNNSGVLQSCAYCRHFSFCVENIQRTPPDAESVREKPGAHHYLCRSVGSVIIKWFE